ncbi:MAG: Fe-S cluster assembly protein SufD [Candidatus Diapherotrites archaeon]|nr:Fe-S cluster assembly protein SufD [Candidatus Diapherotrites archaeon]
MQAMEQIGLSNDGLNAFARSLHEPNWVHARRLSAWEEFSLLPTPSFRYGLDIALNASGLSLQGVALPSYERAFNPQWKQLESKHPGLVVQDLHDAFSSHGGLVCEYLFSSLQTSTNKLDALHAAYWNQGVFVFVPAHTVISAPIELPFNSGAGNAFQHVLAVIGEGARVSFNEHAFSPSTALNPFIRTSWVELKVHPQAHVDWFSVQDLNGGAFNFSSRKALVQEGAGMNFWSAEWGSKVARSEVSAVLNGRGASSRNYGVYAIQGEQQLDLDVASVHEAPETVSDMHTRGVVMDHSKSIYRGLVKMRANAARSNGYQKSDNLLLHEGAEVDAVPYLEIEANDVKCSHGTSVGHVDEEKLFYLMSRGIPEAQAVLQVAQGFLAPVLDKAPQPQWVSRVRARVQEKVSV